MKTIATVVGLVLLSFALSPQVLRAQSLDAAGKAAIDDWLTDAVRTTHIPGIVALVVNKDGVIYENAFGLMETGTAKPMANDAIFQLASMGKAITSLAIMTLVEDGRIALDAPASHYLPTLAGPTVYTSYDVTTGRFTTAAAHSDYTIRQLLTHTSGLGYTFTSDILAREMAGVAGARATALPLLFQPGSSWHYGESTRVLGEIIEAVSGKELSVFLAERILAPLRMDDTTYDVPAAKNPRVVTVHRSDGTRLVETPKPAVIASPHQGDGGLYGTARDYSQFIRVFLNGGSVDGVVLARPETIEQMGQSGSNGIKVKLMHSTNKLLSEDFPLGAGVDTYALGFQRTEVQAAPDLRSVGSLSWAGIYNTEFWIDPQQQVGAVLLMQYLPFYDKTAIDVLQGFERRIYQHLRP